MRRRSEGRDQRRMRARVIEWSEKTISVLVMTRVAKLGTDEHKPIKAL